MKRRQQSSIKKIKVLGLTAQLIFFTSCISATIEQNNNELIEFEAPLARDARFVNESKAWTVSEFERINRYFEIPNSTRVKVEILPFNRNPEFKNCARTYGSERIYIHSLESLEGAGAGFVINPYCRSRSYKDLKYTLVHEYIHTRTLLLLREWQLPKWAWEGIAIA